MRFDALLPALAVCAFACTGPETADKRDLPLGRYSCGYAGDSVHLVNEPGHFTVTILNEGAGGDSRKTPQGGQVSFFKSEMTGSYLSIEGSFWGDPNLVM